MNTKPRNLLSSRVRPQNWNPNTGDPLLDWETILNDWFIYTVDWHEGPTNHSVQLLANRDNSYTIIHSPRFLRETGVFTSQQRRVIKEIFSAANLPAYRADSLGLLALTFGGGHQVTRLGLWSIPGHSGNACWGETNLSPTTQYLIATLDQFLSAKVGTTTHFPARSILSN